MSDIFHNLKYMLSTKLNVHIHNESDCIWFESNCEHRLNVTLLSHKTDDEKSRIVINISLGILTEQHSRDLLLELLSCHINMAVLNGPRFIYLKEISNLSLIDAVYVDSTNEEEICSLVESILKLASSTKQAIMNSGYSLGVDVK
ncbi:hypothetical protein D5952_14015 [Salmonella enterica subsp. enterica]|nr:hypothetical protein [Salmonella enterica subsp. enterica serovar Bonn]EBZ5939295.1 hypothetical protein [Salmonella enterica subsp. enterica serovar Muenchen]MLZ41039.1 hypothetical protein [Salmonella enterica subsp. enterica serovar Bonn]